MSDSIYPASPGSAPAQASVETPALSEAVAWSIAALRSPGTRMLPLTDADRRAVVVHDRVDRDRVLSA